MIETTRRFFNERAERWDAGITEQVVSSSEKLVRGLRIAPGSSVLDVGCGTGLVIPWLMDAVGGIGRITALDVAENMLKLARDKFQAPNVEFVRGCIEETPFLDGSFDVVICHNCFALVADKGRASREMCRVLKPGGRAVISHAESRESVNRSYRVVRTAAQDEELLPGEAGMRALFESAGFRVMSVEEQKEGYLFEARKRFA